MSDASSPKDASPSPPAQLRSLFQIPPALKRVFDRFPLVTYEANELPLRAPRRAKEQHVLYVWASDEDAQRGRPSFNPTCLRWQTYLKLSGISHRVVSSNNHASPSGALPFLLPASKDETSDTPIPGNKLKRWVATRQKAEEASSTKQPEDVRFEAYQSLLEGPLRVAWLFQLYLNPTNAALCHCLYVAPCSSNPLVQATIAHQLRQAAETEIIKATGSSKIVEMDIMRAAEEALTALATLLGEGSWFFDQERPGLFDASVFAYTHLLLDGQMAWESNRLGEMLKAHEGLVQHRNSILEMYY